LIDGLQLALPNCSLKNKIKEIINFSGKS